MVRGRCPPPPSRSVRSRPNLVSGTWLMRRRSPQHRSRSLTVRGTVRFLDDRRSFLVSQVARLNEKVSLQRSSSLAEALCSVRWIAAHDARQPPPVRRSTRSGAPLDAMGLQEPVEKPFEVLLEPSAHRPGTVMATAFTSRSARFSAMRTPISIRPRVTRRAGRRAAATGLNARSHARSAADLPVQSPRRAALGRGFRPEPEDRSGRSLDRAVWEWRCERMIRRGRAAATACRDHLGERRPTAIVASLAWPARRKSVRTSCRTIRATR